MLKNFTVMDLIQTRSGSVATVKERAIKFTATTATELGSPSHIQFMIHAKKKQFAIRPCKEDAPNAIRFVKPEITRQYPITITMPAIVSQIRGMADWEDGSIWCVPGIYSAEDNALIYDLAAARPPVTRAKRKPKETEDFGEAEEQSEV